MAEAIAEVMLKRWLVWGECPKGTRPAPAPPPLHDWRRALRPRRGRHWSLNHMLTRSGPTAPTRAGKRAAFPDPLEPWPKLHRAAVALSPLPSPQRPPVTSAPNGRGHRRGHVETSPRSGRGPEAHGQRPPRDRRALRPRRGRHRPLNHMLTRSGPTAPTRAGKRAAFPDPPELWPKSHGTAIEVRPLTSRHTHPSATTPNDRGHRRGHAAPYPHRAVGPKPTASARPAGGGCYRTHWAGDGLSLTR